MTASLRPTHTNFFVCIIGSMLCFVAFFSSMANPTHRQLQHANEFVRKRERSFKINSAANVKLGGNPHAGHVPPSPMKGQSNPLAKDPHLGALPDGENETSVLNWYKIDVSNFSQIVASKGKVYYSIFCK
jgi:hypothetical protein